jgi:hypothetical protein
MTKRELKSQVRLYSILAREANRAVVFRRGPSKRVQLLLWHTDTDEFEDGQWFKGRIYERRCDLSPSGKLLVYFAANYKLPYFSWTAVSKPPFLTALALWPKGDCWGGGGLFEKERKLRLNHGDHEMTLADGFTVPSKFSVEKQVVYAGRGEDSPVFDMRLNRDGWKNVQTGEEIMRELSASVFVEFKPAIVWSKTGAASRGRYELQMHIRGIKERDGPWYILDHLVKDTTDGATIALERTDWADWCHSGDLLFAKDGGLFRLGFSREGVLNELADAKLVIDLNDRAFTELVAPAEAKQWFS